MLDDLFLQLGPFPESGRRNTPQIELELALACRASLPSLIRPFSDGHLHTGLACSVIDRLKDLDIQFLRGGRVKWHAQRHERVCETLNPEPDGTVAHVRPARFGDGVVVSIDDAIQVERDGLGHVVELLEVVLATPDESWEREGSEVAHGYFFG